MMNLQYITDQKGHTNAVQVPIKDWEKIKKDLEELDKLRNKNQFLAELAEAVKNLNLVKQGKLKARPAKDLLDEL